MDDGNTVDMGSPCEAIENTCDLESVVEMLEKHGLLEKYQEEIDAARMDSGSEEDDVDGDGLVEKDGEKFVLDPEDESESEEDDGKTLMKDGEVIG
jgi:hypothetical protein